MKSNEKTLLEKLTKMCGDENTNTLENKFKLFWNSKKNKNEREFFSSLHLLLKGNGFIEDSELLGYKDIICGNILRVLNLKYLKMKKYREENILNSFLSTDDSKFKKISYFSYLIGRKKGKYMLTLLLSILRQKNLDLLRKLEITNLEDNQYFIFLIDKNDINDFIKENEKNTKDIDLLKFINNSEENFANYYFGVNNDENSKDEIFRNNTNENNNTNNQNVINNANNNEQNNENIININNENTNNNININMENNNVKENQINFNIINNEEDPIILNDEKRIERIRELINNTLSISFNKKLQNNNFLKSNHEKLENIKDPIDFGKILLDCYDEKTDVYENKEKLYLFSPVSLVFNNIKDKFEKNDFEIFNDDNHYIEMFGLYLEEVINKINSYINEGKDKDYIINNKIKFGCYKGHFYICCQLNDVFKTKYYKETPKNLNRIKANVPEGDSIKILQIKDNEKSKNNKSNKTENFSAYSASKTTNMNYRNEMAYRFENNVNEFISDDECENLQNIIFFFNLKIPIVDNEGEIDLESVRLSFYQQQYMLYGFREIDICFKNKNDRIIDKNEILTNNICYINNVKKFNEVKNQEIDISLKKNSIVFCEVKNSFPTIKSGNEKCSEIQITNPIENNENASINYMDQMDNLYKKAKLFYNFFLKEKKIDKSDFIHILYLYDESNVADWQMDYDEIKKNIDVFFKAQSSTKDFKNIIFQIGYFDKIKYNDFKEQELNTKEQELKIREEKINKKLKFLKDHGVDYEN